MYIHLTWLELEKVLAGTETTQLTLNYESCEELRRVRFDETSILAGASLKDA